MTDVDISPFGDHNEPDDRPGETSGNISLTPGGAMGGATWEPDCEQEALVGETSLREEFLKEHANKLYDELSGYLGLKLSVIHYENLEIKAWHLYYRELMKPFTKVNGEFMAPSAIADLLHIKRLCALGYDIPMGLTHRQAAVLNKVEHVLPSMPNRALRNYGECSKKHRESHCAT